MAKKAKMLKIWSFYVKISHLSTFSVKKFIPSYVVSEKCQNVKKTGFLRKNFTFSNIWVKKKPDIKNYEIINLLILNIRLHSNSLDIFTTPLTYYSIQVYQIFNFYLMLFYQIIPFLANKII